MLVLHIEHPRAEPMDWVLPDGECNFPPPDLETVAGGRRLQLVVRGARVLFRRLSREGDLVQSQRTATAVELGLGDTVRFDDFQFTLHLVEPPLERLPEVSASDVGSLRMQGLDRWLLVSLFTAGRIGRNDLSRAVTIYRNDRIAGKRRGIVSILRKGRFFGSRLEMVLREVFDGWHLGCTSCGRRFDPGPLILKNFRCLECDRRLACVPMPKEGHELETTPVPRPTTYDGLTPGMVLDGYKIEQLLGIGGYGAVYKAFDTRIQRSVALKVFPASREGSDDVIREARNVASFPPHPNLVLVYHVGQARNFDYISYEHVRGHSLAHHLDRKTRFTLEESLQLMRDTLRGLSVAHRHGVIHRDMKPDNVLLVRVEGRFRARLTDFGLGQRLRRGQGAYYSRTVRGVPEYLAPEQFRTQVSSVASDLYSVGATFFHLLAGRAPFVGLTDAEVAESHLDDPIPSLLDLRTDCPRSLDRLVQSLLAKEPKNRPASATEVLDQLESVEQELVARRERASRWFPRVAWVAALLLLGTGGTLAWHQWGADWWYADHSRVVSKTDPPDSPEGNDLDGDGPAGNGGSQSAGLVGGTGGAAAPGENSEPPGDPSTIDAEAETQKDAGTDPKVGDRKESEQGTEATGAGADTDPLPEKEVAAPPAEGLPPTEVPPATEVMQETQDEEPTEVEPPQIPEIPAIAWETHTAQADLADLSAQVEAWLLAREARGLTGPANAELHLVVSLLKDTAFVVGSRGLYGDVSFVDRRARRSLKESAEVTLDSVPLWIYSADQVSAWLAEDGVRLEALELDGWLSVDLPAPDQIPARWMRPADAHEAVDLLEWVRDAKGLVLLDHSQGTVREASRAATYRRRSTARRRLRITDPDGFRDHLKSLVEREEEGAVR